VTHWAGSSRQRRQQTIARSGGASLQQRLELRQFAAERLVFFALVLQGEAGVRRHKVL
jgi:hypothetical protein